jgi:hypothetical protein
MSETIDGSQTLVEQESAIQLKEARGYRLTDLHAGAADPPTNVAEFEDLPAGHPVRIHLVEGSVPSGEKEVWSGEIYINSSLKHATAYRKAESERGLIT